jgi:hypothetical protein
MSWKLGVQLKRYKEGGQNSLLITDAKLNDLVLAAAVCSLWNKLG